MSKTIGIDLGTTNSCVAVMEGGKAVVIPNNEGARTTPSVVAVAENGDQLVGQVARRQAVTNPVNTLYAVKRFIGRRFDDPEIQGDIQRATYKIVRSERGDAWVEVHGQQMSPPQVSALVLARMKKIAEDYLGESVDKAVVTVPAYFNDGQRQATRDAGRIAGLQVERILNEPTAAALAYGLDEGSGKRIAVYDLGGGTFDISILELDSGVFNVLATNGDTHLGGEDFDAVLIDYLCSEFHKQHGVDLRQDKMALQRIKEAAEKAKHELSSVPETEVSLPFIAATSSGPQHVQCKITRAAFEQMSAQLVERSISPCELALRDAGLTAKDLDDVLLVGGQTRMPLVQQRVAQFFGREPNREINPDEVVARGAAVQGAVLTGEVKTVLLLDVTPLTLGIELSGGVFSPIIPRNTTVPTSRAQVFSTAEDHQGSVHVHVLQGERPMAEHNQSLARFELSGFPPAPRGVPQIEVTFEIDANGILQVSAAELGSGREQSIRVAGQAGLNEAEVHKLVAEAEEQKDADSEQRRIADLRVRCEALIYTTERSLVEYQNELPPGDVELIRADVEVLKAALETDSAQDVEESYKALETSAYKIAATIYAHTT